MTALNPLASAPLAGFTTSGNGQISVNAGSVTVTTLDAAINTGAVVQVDNGVATTGLSAFSSAFGGSFASGTVKINIHITTLPAQVYASTAVTATAGTITITPLPASIQVDGALVADTAYLTITTLDPDIQTSRYIYADTATLTITSGVHNVGHGASIFVIPRVVSILPLTAEIAVPAFVYPVCRQIVITRNPVRIKMGRNPKMWAERQKFSPDTMVTLYELDATALGGEYMRFTSSAHFSDVVRFGGNTYTPIPVDVEGFEVSGKGTLPTPRLRVLNTPTLQSGVIALDDMLGASFYRIRTFEAFLDGGSDPDPNAMFPIDAFKLERKVSQNKIYIEWELSAAIDQEGRMIPARQIIKDYCTHIYRVWNPVTESFDYSKATCPYAGGSSYDNADNPTNAASDKCGKRLSSCRKRFGNNAELPTRAFPGVTQVR